MAKGISLHIGLNRIDPHFYGGQDGKLVACEFDAKDMMDLAFAAGFKGRMLLTEDATYERVKSRIIRDKTKLEPGDFYLLTYSGHGGQLRDLTGDEDEGRDETWVLFDRQLLDDELYQLFSDFRAGVRILVLSDSCHSGTVTKALFSLDPELGSDEPLEEKASVRTKTISREMSEANIGLFEKEYREALASVKDFDKAEIGASVILISGCQDSQESLDGDRNGLFTEHVLSAWNNGSFQGNYADFHAQICVGMPPEQTPNLFPLINDPETFESESPFKIL